MLLKILGVAAAIWLGFVIIGWVVHAFFWLLVVGAIVFVAATAISWNKRKEIR